MECFQHAWLSQNVEPPSPSPLMLKIPAPDHFVITAPPLLSSSSNGLHHSSPSSRRSCQTCRDKITERKRYLSKSREAIFEKVANSNLKKSLSKSRERLCDMRLTLSKSRDYLNESSNKMAAVRSQEKFYGLKSLSRSQEVLALTSSPGGHVKRRVNGALSDISPAHLPLNPRAYLDTLSPNNNNNDDCDFVILPGSSVLMSHADLMSLSTSSINIRTMMPDSPLLVVVETSGRTTPTTPIETAGGAHSEAVFPAASSLISKLTVQTVVEETEDEDEDKEEEDKRTAKRRQEQQKEKTPPPAASVQLESLLSKSSQRRKSMHDAQNNSRAVTVVTVCSAKEEKNSINYETKQSMSRSASADGINQKLVNNNNNYNNNNSRNNSSESYNSISSHRKPNSRTAEVAVQVNLTRSCSSGNLVRRVQQEAQQVRRGSSASRESIAASGNLRTGEHPERRLTRGFSHDDTLGEDSKRYSWREELERFRAAKKPLGVSDLIDAFSSNHPRKGSTGAGPLADDSVLVGGSSSLDQLKNRRRGSLQIQIDTRTLATLTELAAERERSHNNINNSKNSNNNSSMVKLQRRKSTSAIMPTTTARGGTEATKLPPASTSFLNPVAETVSSSCTITTTHSRTAVVEKGEKADPEKEDPIHSTEEEGEEGGESAATTTTIHHQGKGRAYLEKVNERKRTWDYFEINHPKAISDKKLEQLKAKYTRRKTEACLATTAATTTAAVANKDNSKCSSSERHEVATTMAKNNNRLPTRTMSMPLIQQQQQQLSEEGRGKNKLLQLRPLNLAWDPLTGASIGEEEEEQEQEQDKVVKPEQQLVESPAVVTAVVEHVDNRKSSCYRLSGGHFADLLRDEQIIPREEVLECFIDPFTG